MQMNETKDKLCKIAIESGVYDYCSPLWDDAFWVCSGSSKPFQHHYGDGGLAQHTLEVTELCIDIANKFGDPELKQELLVSAIFHDYGKVWDYVKIDGVWTSSQHKRNIHHISRSVIEWNKHAYEYDKMNPNFIDAVTHNILAHHGCREYGSPVAPKSRAAWILHLCDGISARMNDCETLDVVNR